MPPTEVTGENSLLLYQQKIQTNLFFHGGDYHARSYATGTGQDRTLPEEVERLLRVESQVLRSMGAQHALSTTLRFHRRWPLLFFSVLAGRRVTRTPITFNSQWTICTVPIRREER
jgi:hypothetical protein